MTFTKKKLKKKQIIIGGDRMNREDFPILNGNLIYFDSGATTLKPSCQIGRAHV